MNKQLMTTGNRVVTRQLSLDPLTLAHGGTYICTAQYIVNGVEITTGSGSETVSIAGMKFVLLLYDSSYFHTQTQWTQ